MRLNNGSPGGGLKMTMGNYMGIGYEYVQSVEPCCLMGACFQYVTTSRVLGWDETDPAHEGEI
jgi:hypothetical protein